MNGFLSISHRVAFGKFRSEWLSAKFHTEWLPVDLMSTFGVVRLRYLKDYIAFYNFNGAEFICQCWAPTNIIYN